MAQPIQAVQIYYEHPFGAEREVLREFFSFVGCLVKTTMMPVETMLEKHKSLANPESEQITHLFLADRPPEGIVLSKKRDVVQLSYLETRADNKRKSNSAQR